GGRGGGSYPPADVAGVAAGGRQHPGGGAERGRRDERRRDLPLLQGARGLWLPFGRFGRGARAATLAADLVTMSASNPAFPTPCPDGAPLHDPWSGERTALGGTLAPPSKSRAWGSRLARVWRFVERHHGAAAGIAQAVLAALACVVALNLRFDGSPPEAEASRVMRALPFLLLIRGVWLWPFHLYRDAWRYVGMRELANIFLAVSLGSATFWLFLICVPEFRAFPRSVILLDGLL